MVGLHYTANMEAEPSNGFTAMENIKAEKGEEADVVIAQIFNLNDDAIDTDEKGSGDEVTLKELMGEIRETKEMIEMMMKASGLAERRKKELEAQIT